MAVVFQGRSNRRQWFFSVAALFLLGWSLLLTSEKNVRFTSPYHTNPERPHTSSPFRFNSSADILSFYGSGSAFKERLASYLPGQKKYHQGQQPEYSIKPIVYIFPQFHAIPENDKFWGKNFTEWTNVNKITLNKYGIEVQHPSEEIGQYNLLDLSTRQRYTQTLKNSSIYGVSYHHYWFGYPVMDKALQAMLKDGHPDIPFMLNWANEPWTVRWDGQDFPDGTLLAQNYGDVEDWKKHFDFLAPFFRNKNYIRVNDKVQMQIYNPSHIGDLGKKMFEAWRMWAAQDPTIRGLDVIETALAGDNPNNRGPTDSMNEFGVRCPGGLDGPALVQNFRMHRTWYRGTLVSWDNTPRHATDGGGESLVFSHPKLWKQMLIRTFARIKSDPNPLGEENFFFINAFNEWGEGNTLESSDRWGTGYMDALDEAMEYADDNFQWAPHQLLDSPQLAKEVIDNKTPVDVCVIIREFNARFPFEHPWTLWDTIDSLHNMNNKRWRAVVASAVAENEVRRIDVSLLNANEPRIVNANTPADTLVKSADGPDGANATDWVIKNLDTISPSCAGATYMLITNATTQYEPDAFDGLDSAEADIIGLNFESMETMRFADRDRTSALPWDHYCERFENGQAPTCMSATPDSELLDLGAAFVKLDKWRREGVELLPAIQESGETGILRQLAKQSPPWTWEPPKVESSSSCHMFAAMAKKACNKSGRVWADLPVVEPYNSGCYSGFSLMSSYPGPRIPEQWDYPKRFDANPFCIRVNEEWYKRKLGDNAVKSALSA